MAHIWFRTKLPSQITPAFAAICLSVLLIGCSDSENTSSPQYGDVHTSSAIGAADGLPEQLEGPSATGDGLAVPGSDVQAITGATPTGPGVPTMPRASGPGTPYGAVTSGDSNGSPEGGENPSPRSPTTTRPGDTAPGEPNDDGGSIPTFGPTGPTATPPPGTNAPTPTPPPLRSQLAPGQRPTVTVPVTVPVTSTLPPPTPLGLFPFGCEVNLFLGGSSSQPLVTLSVTEANRNTVWVVLEWPGVNRLVELTLSGGRGSSVQLAPQVAPPTARVYGASTGRQDDLGCVSIPA